MTPTRRWLPRPLALAVLLGYLLCGALLTQHLLGDPAHRVVADNPSDSDLFAWFATSMQHSIATASNPFYMHGMNAPTGLNAMWNTTILVPAVALSWLTALVNGTATVTVLLWLGPALTAFTAWLVVRRWVRSELGAVLAGAMTGFSPAVTHSSLGHLHLVVLPLVPLLVGEALDLFTGRVPDRVPWRSGLRVGLLATAQLLTGEEMLAQAAVLVAVMAVVLVLSRPRMASTRARPVGVASAVAVLTVLVLAAYPLWVQVLGPLRMTGSPFGRDYYVNDLLSFITPSSHQLVHSAAQVRVDASFRGGIEEHVGFVGLQLLAALVALACWQWRDLRIRVGVLSAVVMGALSLGERVRVHGRATHVWLPWHLLRDLPFFDAALANRFSIVLAPMLGLALAAGLDRARSYGRFVSFTAGTVAVLCLISWVPRPLAAVTQPATPGFFTSAELRQRIHPDETVLVVPFPMGRDTAPLRWQMAADLRFVMPGGYFLQPGSRHHAVLGPIPGATTEVLRLAARGRGVRLTHALRKDIAADLAAWGVGAVFCGPSARPDVLRAELVSLLGRQPDRDGIAAGDGVDVWYLTH